jgi:hypothetical protein
MEMEPETVCPSVYGAWGIESQCWELCRTGKSWNPTGLLSPDAGVSYCIKLLQVSLYYFVTCPVLAWLFRRVLDLIIVFIRPLPVTVAERSKACTVFARLEVGIVDSNPTEDMDVWCLCVCVCVCVRARFSVFVYRQSPCDELITCPRCPADCLRFSKLKWNGKFHGGRPRPELGL